MGRVIQVKVWVSADLLENGSHTEIKRMLGQQAYEQAVRQLASSGSTDTAGPDGRPLGEQGKPYDPLFD